MKFRAIHQIFQSGLWYVMVKVASVASIRSCVWPFCRKSSSAHSSTPHIFKNDQVSNPQEGELQQLATYSPSNMIFSSPSVWLSSSFTNSFVVVTGFQWMPVRTLPRVTGAGTLLHLELMPQNTVQNVHSEMFALPQWLYYIHCHLDIQWKENNKYLSPNDLDICQVARDSSYLPLTELIASRPLKPKRNQLKTAWRDAKKTDWTSCFWVVLGCNICTQLVGMHGHIYYIFYSKFFGF